MNDSVESKAVAQLSTAMFVLRWVFLTTLAFAIAIACVLFGKWQWTRTQDIVELERAQLSAPVDALTLTATTPGSITEGLGRKVSAVGNYDAQEQVVIDQRLLGDQAGVWIVTPLRLADGTSIPVLRGWLPSASEAGSTPPTGEVTVSGVLTKYEKFYSSAAGVSPITMSEEVLRSGSENTRNAVLWLTAQQPNPNPAPQPVPADVVIVDVPFPWQNFFYAFQWWIFAAFAVALWARWLTIDVRARRSAATVETS